MLRKTLVGKKPFYKKRTKSGQKPKKAKQKLLPGDYTYQQTQRYFAQVAAGLDDLATEELKSMGAWDVHAGYRGLFFCAKPAQLYGITYQSRFIQKIIAPLSFFDCHSTKYLYRRAKDLPWTKILGLDQTLAIVSNVSNCQIRHSKYAALCVKDAIVDQFKEQLNDRPNIDTKDPDVWLNLHMSNDRATIGLEVSGGSLHKRGYRIAAHEAPIQETVGAAIIRFADWDGQQPLVDPMCGSGTLLAEALMHYCRIPAGYLRKRFGFEALPDFDADLWQQIKAEIDRQMRPLPEGLISGSDIDATILDGTRENLAQLPYGDKVTLKHVDFRNIKELPNTTIVANPPHGLRLQKKEGMDLFCKELGDFLKQRCGGSTAYLYFGNRELIKKIGLRTTWKKPLASGGLDGRLIKLEMY